MTNTNLKWNQAAAAEMTAAGTENGIWVTPGADEATVLILTAAGAMDVTISAGDGMLAVLTGRQICLYDTDLDVKKYISPEPGVTNIILMRGNKLIMITPQEIFIA